MNMKELDEINQEKIRRVNKSGAYLKVEKIADCKFRAFLTSDGRTIWNDSVYEVELDVGNGVDEASLTAKIKGEFIVDFDMKLEALEMMKWLDTI